jgi:hypothetical protein
MSIFLHDGVRYRSLFFNSSSRELLASRTKIMVNVSFSINVDRSFDFIHETDLPSDLGAYIKPEAWSDVYGKIIVQPFDNSERVVILTDDLGCAITRVCFESVENLASGQAYIYEYFTGPQEVCFHPNGETIVISYDDDNTSEREEMKVSAEEFISSAVACGKRFVSLLENVETLHPAFLKSFHDRQKEAESILSTSFRQ